jgi:hypothetical protein
LYETGLYDRVRTIKHMRVSRGKLYGAGKKEKTSG